MSRYPSLRSGVRLLRRAQTCWLQDWPAQLDCAITSKEALALSLCTGRFTYEEVLAIHARATGRDGAAETLEAYDCLLEWHDTPAPRMTRYDPATFIYQQTKGVMSARGRMDLPVELCFVLTHACNFRCKYCFNSSGQRSDTEMSTARWQELVREGKDMDVGVITLTGGEPMLHPGFFDIVETIMRADIYPHICTNGSLIGPEEVARLKELGVDTLQISIDTGNREAFDRIVHCSGGYDRTTRAIGLLANAGIRVLCKGVLLPEVVDDVPELYHILDDLGAYSLQMETYDTGPDCRAGTEYLLSMEKITALRERMRGESGRTILYIANSEPCVRWRGPDDIISCGAFVRSVIVLPNGDATACEKILNDPRLIAGNLSDMSLDALWHSERADAIVNPPMEARDEVCKTCEHLATCGGGCYAIKSPLCWNLYGVDPRCFNAPTTNNPYAGL